MKKIIFALATIFVFTACSNLETVQETDDAGNIIAKYTRNKEDYAREGLFEAFDEEGNLMEAANYKNDQLHGERKIFYANGEVEAVEQFANGEYQGNFLGYYEDGALKIAGNYIDNAMSGEWKRYYKNGQTMEVVLFVDNEENGKFIEYHENGNLKTEGFYKNGDNEDGELKIYNENGDLERIMDCVMGRCKTRWPQEDEAKE